MKKILKKLVSWTLIYNICSFVEWTFYYIKDAFGTVGETLHGNGFYRILKTYLHMNPKKDWLGRVYGVINPNLDENGNFDFNNVIFEMDGVNTNTRSYVENWLYKQMILVNNVFNMDKTNFFEYINMELEHVGPIEHDNYLVIFDLVSRKNMMQKLKRIIKQSILYIILIGIYWYFVIK